MSVEKRKWAIFTIVRDEQYYLPIWYKYYSQYLADQDIHVIHHVPESKSAEFIISPKIDTCCDFLRNKECKIYVEGQEFFSSRWIRDVVKQYQSKLLQSYEAVIFTDVDEIITVHPSSGFSGLGQFMDSFLLDQKHTNWRVTAFSVIHMPDLGEKDFDFSKRILEQRMYWYRDEYYDKPLISKIPLDYVLGHHTAPNMNEEHNPHLYMIHLHQFDFEWYIKRHQRWANEYKVSEEDKNNTFNSHYRLQDREKLIFQYYHELFSQNRIAPVLIERWVRERLASI